MGDLNKQMKVLSHSLDTAEFQHGESTKKPSDD